MNSRLGIRRATARSFWALALLAGMLPAAAVAQQQWNQFRGPQGDGHAGNPGLPLEFGEDQNVRWKVPIPGKGWSSPVVWNDQIWLTTAPEDGKQMFALAVDLKSGRVVHEVLVFENAEPQYCHDMNSYATPTPVVEQDRVYVHFGVHGTACLNTASGKILWTRRDLPCNHHRGPASSPIVVGELLVVHFDGYDVQYVVALDKNTGETVWKHDRAFDYGTNDGDQKKAYGTPTVIDFEGRKQLIAPAAIATEALDPVTGKLLWTVKHGGMNASARPIFGHGLVFITNGMGRMVSVSPVPTADATADVAWESGKGVPKKSSPLLIGDLLFLISDEGVATCVEARTGEQVWSKRLGGEFAASPLYADGRIYCFSREGEITVIAPERELKILARNKLEAGFMASPAVAGNSLILRTTQHLYRIAE